MRKCQTLWIVSIFLWIFITTGDDFICDDKKECFELAGPMVCASGEACYVYCTGDDACKEAVIDGNGATSLSVVCTGRKACKEAVIDGNSATSLRVVCTGYHVCKSAHITCPTGAECDIICGAGEQACGCHDGNTPWPCENALQVDATGASSVSITGDSATQVALTTSAPSKSPTDLPTVSSKAPSKSPTTPAPTTDDSDDDDNSSESGDMYAAVALSDGENNIENDENTLVEHVVIKFSKSAAMNIFGIVCVFILGCGVIAYCFCVRNEKKGKAEFVDNV